MSTLTNDLHSLSTTRAASWRIDPGFTFEVTVKTRPGPLRVAGSAEFAEGLVGIDRDGQIQMGVTIDTASLDFHGTQRDARLLSHRLPGLEDSSIVRFASTEVTDVGAGRLHVSGVLSAGATRVPLELEAEVTTSERTLEVVATMVVEHRRLGLIWIPAGPTKAPTELVVRARLIPIANDERADARERSPQHGSTDSRYRFMARAA